MKHLLGLSLLLYNFTFAQTTYKKDDFVKDIYAKKIINYKESSSSSLNNLKGKITIIDFFGTWCSPCIKGLPDLKYFKNKFKNDLNIILISNETELKLTAFTNARKLSDFPIIIDEENLFFNAFKPPSYPYTILLDQDLKILSITNVNNLNDSILERFIQNQNRSIENKESTKILDTPSIVNKNITTPISSENTLLQLSQDFIYATKTNENAALYITKLKAFNYDSLVTYLKTDNEKKAFWINLYNAYTNFLLHKNPEQYKNRNKFFHKKNIIVAGKILSLDNIEHDILRRNKIKWSLGYLNKVFLNKAQKELRVKKLDNRIHFALNCGAKSCPPIAFYKTDKINDQLDIATKNFLTSEIEFDKVKNKVQLPILFSWFRKDFGGKKKIITLIKNLQLIPENANPKIKFKKYDWTLYLENYKN